MAPGVRIDTQTYLTSALVIFVNIYTRNIQADSVARGSKLLSIKKLPYFSIDNARVIYTKKGLNS